MWRLIAIAVLLLGPQGHPLAQGWPNKPARVIVPSPSTAVQPMIQSRGCW